MATGSTQKERPEPVVRPRGRSRAYVRSNKPSLPVAYELSISEEEERSTAAAFLGFVSEAAQSDGDRGR